MLCSRLQTESSVTGKNLLLQLSLGKLLAEIKFIVNRNNSLIQIYNYLPAERQLLDFVKLWKRQTSSRAFHRIPVRGMVMSIIIAILL